MRENGWGGVRKERESKKNEVSGIRVDECKRGKTHRRLCIEKCA